LLSGSIGTSNVGFIYGDFSLEMEIQYPATRLGGPSGTEDMHLYLYPSGILPHRGWANTGNALADVSIDQSVANHILSVLRTPNSSDTTYIASISSSPIILYDPYPWGTPKLKILRSSGLISTYYNTGSGYTQFYNGSTPLSISYSKPVWIGVDAGKYNGIKSFNFSAASGLPYYSSVSLTGVASYSGNIIAYSPTIVTGDIAGVSYISGVFQDSQNFLIYGSINGESSLTSIVNDEKNTFGLIDGLGSVYSKVRYFPSPTEDAPLSSGDLDSSIKVLLTNKSNYPYFAPSGTIISKIDVLRNNDLSYLEDYKIELWMNYSHLWTKCEEMQTTRYGSCYINHSTENIPTNVTNCFGIAKLFYNDVIYVSNIIRYNFYF
jgi:hypothetical protein